VPPPRVLGSSQNGPLGSPFPIGCSSTICRFYLTLRAIIYVEVTLSDDVDLTLVTLTFDAADVERLVGVLANYVVISRGQPGCRNIDLAASATTPGRFVVIEKWETPAAQRAHFDSPAMVDMARSCEGLLSRPPQIDLLDAISAHDLA
jgi:quinol monooxygenase YgiN